jgi:hypothetical protein
MAVSKVDICNLALVDLGHETIMSLEDTTAEAAICNAKIDHCIDVVSAGFNWNCGLKEVELAPLTSASSQQYDYSYQLPSDCLKPIKIQGHAPGKDYVLRGAVLCTDAESPLYLLYIKRLSTDLSCMDELMVAAVAARLASEIAYKLTGSSSKVDQMIKLYATKVQEAKDQNAIMDDEEYIEEQTTSWITARD